MEFAQLLKLASKNQKNAEKKLPQKKKYSTSLPPPKKAERPKVNTDAIRALIKKKEKTKQQEECERKKQLQMTKKHENTLKEKAKDKSEKTLKQAETNKKIAPSQSNYKSKHHESKHKHFMNMIEKDKDRKQDSKERMRPSQQEMTKKKKPVQQPMNFKELMELAKKKQNGEVIPETNTPKMSHEDRITTKTLSSKKSISNEAESTGNRKPDPKDVQGSKKAKLKNGESTGIESQKKKNSISTNKNTISTNKSTISTNKNTISTNKSTISTNKHTISTNKTNHKVTDAKLNGQSKNDLKKSSVISAKSTVNGRHSNGLKQSAEDLSNNQKAVAVLGGKLKKPNMPQAPSRSNVNNVPVKRKAPPPKMKVKRGRLCSDDDEDEDDDFIDDTGEDVDVSKYIRQIFGYDKRKYGYESEHALNNMEASYTQIMREESRSSRLGRMEDLEDMKQEKMMIERKKASKKKR